MPSREELDKAVKQHGSVRAAARSLDVAESTLRGWLKLPCDAPTTKEHTSQIKDLEQRLKVANAKIDSLADAQAKVRVERVREHTIRFGVFGDVHAGSLFYHPDAMNAYFEYALGRGVKDFFCAGDILDGNKVYRGQEFELRDVGFDAQLKRLKRTAPKEGNVYFITGNHDASFKAQIGVDVGGSIHNELPNWEFLGEDTATYQWELPDGTTYAIGLLHPGGGSAYALSYKPQKIVDSLQGGTKPDLLAVGHFHKSELMPNYRNVTVAQTGTFQKQTGFMARNGLAAHVGAWLFEIEIGKTTKVIRQEFMAFYK